MKALLVTSEFPPHVGGIASHVWELAAALARRTTMVRVIAPGERAPRGTAAPAGVDVDRPGLIRAQPFYDASLRLYLRAVLRRHRFDVIHVHGMRPLAAAAGLGTPLVFTNHSSGFLARLRASERRRRRTTRLLTRVDALIAPSDELLDAARTLGFLGPGRMIANGVDSGRFAPGGRALRAEWGVGDGEAVILLARRLAAKNGVLWFARAMGRLADAPFRLVIAGDGAERDAVRAALEAGGVAERTVFLGAVSNDRMPEVYRAADISVLPSLAEATSIAGLEAMASGLPLVGTSVGGIPAIVEDGVTGLLIAPMSEDGLEAALRRLIGDAELRSAMGEAARRRAVERFDWNVIAGETLEVYADAVDVARRERGGP